MNFLTRKAFLSLCVFSVIGCGGGGGDDEIGEGPFVDNQVAQSESEASPVSGTVRIMPLGDSITEAEAGRASYRRWLWNSLEDEGFDVNFVGGQRNAFGGPNVPSDFDLDHEGHWDYESSDIRFNSPAYAAVHNPDIVLLHIGTNDIIRNRGIDRTLNEVTTIIDNFRAVNPNVVVLLAEVIPSDRSTGELAAYGRSLAELALVMSTSDAPIVSVDMRTDFFVSSDTYDGIHPNSSGEQKMASRWLAALRPFLSQP